MTWLYALVLLGTSFWNLESPTSSHRRICEGMRDFTVRWQLLSRENSKGWFRYEKSDENQQGGYYASDPIAREIFHAGWLFFQYLGYPSLDKLHYLPSYEICESSVRLNLTLDAQLKFLATVRPDQAPYFEGLIRENDKLYQAWWSAREATAAGTTYGGCYTRSCLKDFHDALAPTSWQDLHMPPCILTRVLPEHD